MGRGIGTYILKSDRDRLKSETHCAYCKRPTPVIHIEHIFPIDKGGKSERSNLSASCAKCNALKGTFTLPEFLERLDNKRNILRGKASVYCHRLRRMKRRNSTQLEDIVYLMRKVDAIRIEHSYYSAIAHSIVNNLYHIH